MCARWPLFRMFVMAIAYSLASPSHRFCCFSCNLCRRISVGHGRGSSSNDDGRQRWWWFYCYRLFIFDWHNCLNVWKFKRLFDWFVYCSWLSLVCRLILIIPLFSIFILFSLRILLWLRAMEKKTSCAERQRVEIRAKHLQYFRHYTSDSLS